MNPVLKYEGYKSDPSIQDQVASSQLLLNFDSSTQRSFGVGTDFTVITQTKIQRSMDERTNENNTLECGRNYTEKNWISNDPDHHLVSKDCCGEHGHTCITNIWGISLNQKDSTNYGQ